MFSKQHPGANRYDGGRQSKPRPGRHHKHRQAFSAAATSKEIRVSPNLPSHRQGLWLEPVVETEKPPLGQTLRSSSIQSMSDQRNGGNRCESPPAAPFRRLEHGVGGSAVHSRCCLLSASGGSERIARPLHSLRSFRRLLIWPATESVSSHRCPRLKTIEPSRFDSVPSNPLAA